MKHGRRCHCSLTPEKGTLPNIDVTVLSGRQRCSEDKQSPRTALKRRGGGQMGRREEKWEENVWISPTLSSSFYTIILYLFLPLAPSFLTTNQLVFFWNTMIISQKRQKDIRQLICCFQFFLHMDMTMLGLSRLWRSSSQTNTTGSIVWYDVQKQLLTVYTWLFLFLMIVLHLNDISHEGVCVSSA